MLAARIASAWCLCSRIARPAGSDSDFAGPKDPPALVVQDPVVDQLIDEAAGLERRVELERRVRPQQALVKLGLHMLGDPRIADREEALGVATVVANKMIA